MKSPVLMLHNKYILFFSIAGLFFGLAVSQTIFPVALYSVLISLFFVIALTLCSPAANIKDVPFVLLLMIASFVVKVYSIFFFENLMLGASGIPFLSYKDDYVYDVTSSSILEAWKNRGFGFYDDVTFGTGFYSGYPNVSALAKLFFGDHYLVPRFLNAVFSTLTIPFYFYTVKYLTDNKVLNKIVSMLFAFAPAFIVYTSLQLKETVLIFFVSTSLYGVAHFFSRGISIKSALLVALSMCALLFFRAAILLPLVIALIFAFLAAKEKTATAKPTRIRGFLWVALVVLCFYSLWEYLYSSGLLGLTGEEYFASRFSSRGQADSYQGSSDLSKFGVVAVLLGPILALLSLFLPAPVYVQLNELSDTIPYHYFPLIGYYAILPMVCISLFYIIKKYRLNRMGLFIVAFLVLYKLGQAGSKSILDSRQSLPAIYAAYLLLAYFDLEDNDVRVLWRRYRVIVILMMLIVMFSVTFFRYIARL